MHDTVIRPWREEDRPQLRELWRVCFDDSEEYIDRFFHYFLRPGTCLAAEAEGRVVSAMHILSGLTLFPFRKNTLTAGYTYALATLPEYRGRGIGTAVYKAASAAAAETADIACVLPAEPDLYPFYETASGAQPVSHLREARFTRDGLRRFTPRQAARIPVTQYDGLRESFLSGMPHASFPEAFFDLMEDDGMEFFVMENGLAASRTQDGVCRVEELLVPDGDVMSAASAMASWCPAKEYVVRTPLFFSGPGEARPFMLGAFREAPSFPMPDDLWWGFALE